MKVNAAKWELERLANYQTPSGRGSWQTQRCVFRHHYIPPCFNLQGCDWALCRSRFMRQTAYQRVEFIFEEGLHCSGLCRWSVTTSAHFSTFTLLFCYLQQGQCQCCLTVCQWNPIKTAEWVLRKLTGRKDGPVNMMCTTKPSPTMR